MSTCQVCRSESTIYSENLEKYPLGNIYLSSNSGELPYLRDIFLKVCGGGHLTATSKFSSDSLYNADYPYLGASAVPNSRRKKATELLVSSFSDCEFGNVVDIGCGNFELLEVLRESDFKVSGKFVGVDPVPRGEIPDGITFINDYFSPQSLSLENFNQPNLICMDNVLEHIDELQNFMSDLSKWTSQGDMVLACVPSYELMLERKIFSEISHEHCNYFSLQSLSTLFNEFGFETIAESSEVIHSRGYNFHLFRFNPSTNLGQTEGARGSGTLKFLPLDHEIGDSSFEKNFSEFRKNLKKSLPETFKGAAYGVGASELTPTLAYFLQNDFSSLKGIFDSTPSKFHKFMPGIKPPILPWVELAQLNRNDNLVVLAPSVATEISATLGRMNFSNIWVPDFGGLA